MCYVLLLGTTSSEDLALRNNALVQFRRDIPLEGAAQIEATALRLPFHWYVGSQSICSCSFRHLDGIVGFGEPEDWLPEEPEDIEATHHFIRIVRDLVARGHAVECIDAWEHNEQVPRTHRQLTVLLSSIKDSEFRFFENFHFFFGEAA